MNQPRAGEGRAWILTGVLGCAALGGLAAMPGGPPLRAGVVLPWWTLAIAYFLAGILAVHIGVRRHAHTITLGEVPLVLGLVAASPTALLGGGLAGTALSLTLHRRQPPVKLVFNLVVFLIEVEVAVAVMRAVLQGGTVDSATGWTATLAGALAASMVSAVLVAVAIAVSSGRQRFGDLPPVLGVALAATALNTVFGLGGLDLIEHDARAALVLVIPLAALAVAYRSYIGEQQKHARVELLYETSRALHRSHGVDASITTLLTRARQMFNAEIAEVFLLPTSSTEMARRCTLGPGDGDRLTVHGIGGSDPSARIRSGRPAVLLDAREPDGILASRGFRNGMAVSISGEGGATGTLIVANRRDVVSAFGGDDLALLEAFAGPASVALDNGWLQAELEHLAFHDALTGLPNRALLTQRLGAALDRRGPRRCAVLLLDIDDFKMVNDTLGHPAGDRLLVDVADRLTTCLGPGDTAARLGGDEFAVMLAGVEDRGRAVAVAERVLDAMRPPFTVAECEVAIHASIGVVMESAALTTVEDLLSSADLAMYRAKARGKNQCAVFEPIMQVEVLARHQMRADLDRAVREGQLAVHYQPIVSLQTGEVIGAEALVRWTHELRGGIAPDEFIPLAEETGLVVPLGELVLERACADLAGWSRTLPNLQLGVNVSARQLQTPGFVADLVRVLGGHGIAPSRLTLEVTEHVMVNESEALAALADLRAIGVRIAVDDFGTGYSSLSCLGDLPIDMLKIAKPFIDRLARSDADRALVTTIVGLADSLGLESVAEGIERPDQAAALREAGCAAGQGFLFSRAVPAAEFLARATPAANGTTLTLAG